MSMSSLVRLNVCASGYIKETIAGNITYFSQIRRPKFLGYISEVQAKAAVKT